MPIPDESAGPKEAPKAYIQEEHAANIQVVKVIEVANAALRGEITAEEWEVLVEELEANYGR